MELIRAKPVAAPAPLKNEPAKAQKGPSAPQMPAAAATRQAILQTGEDTGTESRNPAAASTSEPAMNGLRCPILSDRMPRITIKTVAAR